MTTLVVLLVLLAFAVFGLGWGLWQISRGPRSRSREAPSELASIAPARSYSPMSRLFDGRDLKFLQTQTGYQPAMATRLRLDRRKALSLYLRQIHGDFRRSWAYCRAVAPMSESAEFAPAAVKQFFAFYVLFAALQVQCLICWFVFVPMDVRGLLAVVQPLQVRARQGATGHGPTGWGGLARS